MPIYKSVDPDSLDLSRFVDADKPLPRGAAAATTPSAEAFISGRRELWAREPWVKAKDIQRNGTHWFRREAATFHVQSSNQQKILVLERLTWDRFVPSSPGNEPSRNMSADEIEYRLGYFIVSRTGKWWWGQFAAMIPAEDLEPLLDKAREEGTLLSTPHGEGPYRSGSRHSSRKKR